MSDRDPCSGVSAWLLDGRGGGRRLAEDELARWVPADGQLWIDLDEGSADARAWLRGDRGIAGDGRALFEGHRTWPRVAALGPQRLALFWRLPDPDPEGAPEAFVLLRIWLEPERAISMCTRALPELDEVRRRLAAGEGPTSIGDVLLVGTEGLASGLADDLLELRAALADLEVEFERGDSFPVDELRRLRRSAVYRQRYVDPQRDVLLRVRSLRLRWLAAHPQRWRAAIDYFREGSRELAFIADHARALQDSLTHRTSAQMSRSVYVLTLVSTVLMPVSVVAALLGANISMREGNIAGADSPLWFVGLVVAMGLLGAGVYWFFRRLLR
jgi:zinc transporter